MKISVIGGGTMGMTYARNIAKIRHVRAAGICDVNRERAERAAQVCGTNAYTDADELLSSERPDLVCVCLPTPLHKEFVGKLAGQGVHVICEKPIALDLDEADQMIEVCAQHGVRLFIGHVVRFFPAYRDAAERVKAGAIGSAGIAHFKRFGAYPEGEGDWYRDRAKSGGVIMDLMIHDIDFARTVFGEAESVYANVSRTSHPDMEYAQVTLRFSGGRMAILEGLWGYPGAFTTAFEIAGRQGVIRFDSSQAYSRMTKVHGGEKGRAEPVQVPRSTTLHDPYHDELLHFIDCIRSGKEPLVGVRDAYEALKIALAAEQSVRTKQPIGLEDLR